MNITTKGAEMGKIVFGLLVSICIIMICLNIAKLQENLNNIDKKNNIEKEYFSLSKAIFPTVTIQYENYGGGSGTCIYQEKCGDKIELYFLTANHVVDFAMYNRFIYSSLGYYYPLHKTCKPDPIRSGVATMKTPPLIVAGWLYNKNGSTKRTFSYYGEIYKMWNDIDTAIVKVVAEPGSAITKLPIGKIENLKTFDAMIPGDKVVTSGCPYLLPALISDGHMSRKKFGKPGEIPPNLSNVCLVRINIAGGASGGGIYNFKNMKLIGIVSIGWGRNAFICGMIPISDILPKLQKTYLGQKLGL